jgi:hypothetical protein
MLVAERKHGRLGGLNAAKRGHILPSTVTPTEDVETIIGQPATSFQAFAERNAVAWTAEEDK